MGNVTVIIEINLDPSEFKLDEISLWTAGRGFRIKATNIRYKKIGDEVVWNKLENVWYDILIKNIEGKYIYTYKGHYTTGKTIIRLSDIMDRQILPQSY